VQLFSVPFSRTMTGVVVDPNDHILNRVLGTVQNDPTLGLLTPESAAPFRVWPNPAREEWLLEGVRSNDALAVFDEAGRRVWQGKATAVPVRIPCADLPPGVFFLKINDRPEALRLTHF
jgi:hypothetical protein